MGGLGAFVAVDGASVSSSSSGKSGSSAASDGPRATYSFATVFCSLGQPRRHDQEPLRSLGSADLFLE